MSWGGVELLVHLRGLHLGGGLGVACTPLGTVSGGVRACIWGGWKLPLQCRDLYLWGLGAACT